MTTTSGLPDFKQMGAAIQYNIAKSLLMTGPRATPPRHRAVMKTVRRLRAGLKVEGPWRSWTQKSLKGN